MIIKKSFLDDPERADLTGFRSVVFRGRQKILIYHFSILPVLLSGLLDEYLDTLLRNSGKNLSEICRKISGISVFFSPSGIRTW